MPVVSDYTALLSGSRWSVGQPGQAVFLTYSFSVAPTAYMQASRPVAAATFSTFTDWQRNAARAALAQWSAASGITFVETTRNEGDITFGNYDLVSLTSLPNAAGLGTYPEPGGYLDGSDQPHAYSGTSYSGGDIYLAPGQSGDSLSHVLLHEIGHALGLKHPFDGTITLSGGLDTGENTVMSYNRPSATVLGPFDIAAIQYLYGAPGATQAATRSWNAAAETLTTRSTGDAQFVRGTGARDVLYAPGLDDAVVTAQGDDLVIASGQRLTVNGGTGADTVDTGLAYGAITATGGVLGSGSFRYIYADGFSQGSWQFMEVETLLFSDGITYSMASGTAAPTQLAVSIAGAGGSGGFTVPFGGSLERLLAVQPTVDFYNGVIAQGIVLQVAAGAASLPAIPVTAVGQLVFHDSGIAAMPDRYTSAISNAPTPVTIIGGATDGQFVLSGEGGLAFNAGSGRGSVYAGGGNNLVSQYPGAGGQFIQLGAGDDTVIALAGGATIDAGAGHNQILTGAGADSVLSGGSDLIAAGDIGSATITALANDPTVFLGPGDSVFNGGSGHATVVSTAGRTTVNAAGGTQIWLGTNQDLVTTTGADTVIGGAGAATVSAAAGNAFVFAGPGTLDFRGGSGSATILGSASGAATLRGGSGSIIALANAPLAFTGGSGADTIAAFGPGSALTVTGGTGSGLFLGGPAGGNSITGGSGQSIILGGGDGDVLRAGTGAGDVLRAGSGAATLSAAGTYGSHRIYAGAGPNLIETGSFSSNVLTSTGAATIASGPGVDLFAFAAGNHPAVVIQGFDPATDYLSLLGFPVGEAAAALLGASNGAAGERLTLSDGTTILLAGFGGLAAGSFL